MTKDDFSPLMKVSLNGEYGVVTEQFLEVNANEQKKLYGVIRWDTEKQSDFEDWRGLWGTFVEQGGCEVGENYQFRFINDDGTRK